MRQPPDSLRTQALRMVNNWVVAVEALQAGREHPMETIRQLHLREKAEGKSNGTAHVTARGTVTRSKKHPRGAELRALSGEARQADRILRLMENIDPRYRMALVVRVQVPSSADAAAIMRRSHADFGRYYEAGISCFCTCLALNFGA